MKTVKKILYVLLAISTIATLLLIFGAGNIHMWKAWIFAAIGSVTVAVVCCKAIETIEWFEYIEEKKERRERKNGIKN